jgi:hypothetical protein
MHELMHEFRGEILRSVQSNGLALVDQHTQWSPIASPLGLIFGAAFIGFEMSARSIDFFVVGQH